LIQQQNAGDQLKVFSDLVEAVILFPIANFLNHSKGLEGFEGK
jgi:hypothetical protein